MRLKQSQLDKRPPDFAWSLKRFGMLVICECYHINKYYVLNVIKCKASCYEKHAYVISKDQYMRYYREFNEMCEPNNEDLRCREKYHQELAGSLSGGAAIIHANAAVNYAMKIKR